MTISSETTILRLLEALQIAVYETDPAGRITYVSRAFETAFGYSSSELLGRTIDDFLVTRIDHAAAGAEPGLLEAAVSRAAVRHKDGTLVWVRISAEPVRRFETVVGTHGVISVTESAELPEPHPGAGISLTPRQLEVLRLLAAGLSTEEIARALTISLETTRNHIRAILQELGSHSRLEAVVVARRAGLVP